MWHFIYITKISAALRHQNNFDELRIKWLPADRIWWRFWLHESENSSSEHREIYAEIHLPKFNRKPYSTSDTVKNILNCLNYFSTFLTVEIPREIQIYVYINLHERLAHRQNELCRILFYFAGRKDKVFSFHRSPDTNFSQSSFWIHCRLSKQIWIRPYSVFTFTIASNTRKSFTLIDKYRQAILIHQIVLKNAM